MKKAIFAGLTITIVSLFALSAMAQDGPGGPGGPGGGRMRGMGMGGPGGPGGMDVTQIFRNDEIKSQLGLTKEQEDKLTDLLEKNREAMRERFRAGRQGGGGGERPAPPSREEMDKMRGEMDKMREEIKGKVNQILTPEQQEKVKVMRFQASGGLNAPMLNPDSLEVLNLTEDQKAKLKAMEDARRDEFQKRMEGQRERDWRGMSEEDRRKAFEELRTQGEARAKEFKDKVVALLTPDQKAKAEKLTEDGKDLHEKVMQQIRERQGNRRGGDGPRRDGDFRPGADSWRPGQGTQQDANGEKKNRRSFPKSEETKAE